MTTYNTGNPLGSTDARDLYDNAQNLDNFANGAAASYTDRFGVSRRSLAGIDAAADNVLNGIGYAVPVAYASGISLTLTSQTVEYNGVVYAPKSSALPFTTSSWGTDSAKFRAVQVTDAAYLSYTPSGIGAAATTVKDGLNALERNGGASALRAYPRGSVLVHIGDSISIKSGEWGVGYLNGWLTKGGVFEGWTSYNLAANGTPASTWAGTIETGNQAQAPADYENNLTPNVWAAVNADPQVIVFQLGTNDIRMDGSAAAISTLRTNIRKLVGFFLQRTSAHIIMKMPPPIAYANPDPGGFTNCTSAADAAARSASLRTIYREWENASDRVTVVDLQKHLYGLRADSVSAPQDPEGNGALMKDTLHPTNLGATRTAQIIARVIDPSLPYTTSVVAEPIQLLYKDAQFYTLVKVKESGNGYVDIYADSIRAFTGSATRGYPRGSLDNIEKLEALLHAGAANKIVELLQSSRFQLYYPATGAVATLTGFTAVYNQVDGSTGDYWRVSASGTFAGSGVALAYITDKQYLPRRNPENLALYIPLAGALPLTSGACSGAVTLPLKGIKPILNATTVGGTRQSGSVAATVDLYVSNVWSGSYSGSVSAGFPGYKLGSVSFPSGHLQNATWTADPTNFPGGVASLPDTPSELTVIRAVLSSGSLGDYGSIGIKAGV